MPNNEESDADWLSNYFRNHYLFRSTWKDELGRPIPRDPQAFENNRVKRRKVFCDACYLDWRNSEIASDQARRAAGEIAECRDDETLMVDSM